MIKAHIGEICWFLIGLDVGMIASWILDQIDSHFTMKRFDEYLERKNTTTNGAESTEKAGK